MCQTGPMHARAGTHSFSDSSSCTPADSGSSSAVGVASMNSCPCQCPVVCCAGSPYRHDGKIPVFTRPPGSVSPRRNHLEHVGSEPTPGNVSRHFWICFPAGQCLPMKHHTLCSSRADSRPDVHQSSRLVWLQNRRLTTLPLVSTSNAEPARGNCLAVVTS